MDDADTEEAMKSPEDCEQQAPHEDVEMPDSDELKLFKEVADAEELKANAPRKAEPKRPDANPVDDQLKENADEITLKLLEEHADESAVQKALEKDDDGVECPESSPLEDGPEEDNFLQLGSQMQAKV